METKQQRRQRAIDNKFKRENYPSHPGNNRKGQPKRTARQIQAGMRHYARVQRLKKRGGVPVCPSEKEIAKFQKALG